jgi:hypothetical protein
MSGGSLGGGDAWARDHEEILEHARGLGYDKITKKYLNTQEVLAMTRLRVFHFLLLTLPKKLGLRKWISLMRGKHLN